MADTKPRPLLWLAAFLGFETLVLGLVFYLVGVVSGLQRQTVIVLAGVVVFAVGWRLLGRFEGSSDAKSRVTPGERASRSAKDVYWLMASQLMPAIWFLYGLNVYSVGERMWWASVIGLPAMVGYFIYCLADLYRHRHEYAQQREEKWDPWG